VCGLIQNLVPSPCRMAPLSLVTSLKSAEEYWPDIEGFDFRTSSSCGETF
jgi:hypothetical protein